MPAITLRNFDPAYYLVDDETCAHYLAAALLEDDPDGFLQALDDVERARGNPLRKGPRWLNPPHSGS